MVFATIINNHGWTHRMSPAPANKAKFMTDSKNTPVNTNAATARKRRQDEQLVPVEKSGDKKDLKTDRQPEHGGSKGLEPTRYGDWEHNGRCTDF